MIKLIIGVIGLVGAWALRPPRGIGDAISIMATGRYYVNEPVFLAMIAIFGLLTVFGFIEVIKKTSGRN